MNVEQKRAWLTAGSAGISLVLFFGLLPLIGALQAMAAFCLLAAPGFTRLIWRGSAADERDRAILRRAALRGAGASYLTFVLACMGIWVVVSQWQGAQYTSVHILPMIVCVAWAVFYLVHGVAVLALYGRHVEADDA